MKLSYEMIHAAQQGDPFAMQTILDYYEPYINQVSTRCGASPTGNIKYYVDYAVKEQVISELMVAILKWKEKI